MLKLIHPSETFLCHNSLFTILDVAMANHFDMQVYQVLRLSDIILGANDIFAVFFVNRGVLAHFGIQLLVWSVVIDF